LKVHVVCQAFLDQEVSKDPREIMGPLDYLEYQGRKVTRGLQVCEIKHEMLKYIQFYSYLVIIMKYYLSTVRESSPLSIIFQNERTMFPRKILNTVLDILMFPYSMSVCEL
jgi:hypothetical protein